MKTKTLILLSAFTLSSCGTIFTGNDANISLNTSNGKQVKVEVISSNNVQNVTAPAQISVKKANSAIQVRVKDKCYEDTSHIVANKLNIVSLANFLFGTLGTTSALVDINNGNFWTYEDSALINVIEKDDNC
jgi:hypothetical protein